MDYFRFRQSKLYCEELPVQQIAECIETPFYLYSKKTVVDNFDRMDCAFQDLHHLICYALKANSNETLLSLLAQKGAGADVVSRGEIYLAVRNGFVPEKIVYAGVGKTDGEIRYALEQGILGFNAESIAEIGVINEIAKGLNKIAPIAIRVNPNIDIQGHPYISTGQAKDKFGIEIPEVKKFFREMQALPHIELIGLHCHIGSQISEVPPFVKVVQLLKELAGDLRSLGCHLKYVDIGGGLAVRYKDLFQREREKLSRDETDLAGDLSAEELIQNLLPDLQELDCKIIFEPGRSLIASAGVLVTKVLFVKNTQGKRFLIVDAGMSDLIRPSLYGAHHEIVPIKQTCHKVTKVDVVGPICESGDFLARNRWLPEVQRGDFLAVMTVGAYGFSLSSNYNARPRPAEILVDGEKYEVIRAREAFEKVWK